MNNLKEMNEKKAELVRSFDAAVANKEVEQAEKLDAEIVALEGEIKLETLTLKRSVETSVSSDANKVTRSVAKINEEASPEDQALARAGWALHKSGYKTDVTRSMVEAGKRCGLEFDADSIRMSRGQLVRAQSTTDSEGGYLVNKSLFNRLVEVENSIGGLKSVCNAFITEKGTELKNPVFDDTANRAAIISENPGSPIANVGMTFAPGKSVKYFDYTSGIYPVSKSIARDAEIDFDSKAQNTLLRRMVVTQQEHGTTGEGTTEPYGFVTEATAGVTAALTTSFTFDEVIDLWDSIDDFYHAGAVFMCHRNTVAWMMKQVDENNRPLFLDSIRSGVVYTMLGLPIVVNNSMPKISDGAGSAVMALGNFKLGVDWRDVGGYELSVYDKDSAFGLKNQICYAITHSHDSRLVDVNAVKTLKLHA